MKIFAILLICFAAANAIEVQFGMPENIGNFYEELLRLETEAKTSRQLSADINEYVDKAMVFIKNTIVKNGLDPLDVPNVKKGFKVKLGLVTFKGDFILDHGWMQGLSTVQRYGDATLGYENKFLNLRLPLAFQSAVINYDYLAKIMDLGPTGGLEGKIKNLKIMVDITFDIKNNEIILQGFKIIDSGKINLKFSGNALVDWLINALSRVATTVLHDIAVKVLQKNVRELLVDVIDKVNESLPHGDQYYIY